MRRVPLSCLNSGYEEEKPTAVEAWLRRLPAGCEVELGPEGDVIGFSLEVTVCFADGNIVSAIDKIANDLKKSIYRREWDESRSEAPRGTYASRQDG